MMLHLELPHINVLSKMELIESCERLDFAGFIIFPTNIAFSAWRPTRDVYGRSIASTYRRGYMPRPFGSRSLQWRRDTSSGGTSDNSASSLNEPPSALNSVPAFWWKSCWSSRCTVATTSYLYLKCYKISK